MACLICAGPADCIDRADTWEERDCPRCGHYRVSSALILELMEQGQIFDVEKMRTWLSRQQSDNGIPSIEFGEALLVR